MRKKIITILLIALLPLATNKLPGMKRPADEDMLDSKKQKIMQTQHNIPFKHFAGKVSPEIKYIAQALNMRERLTKERIEIPCALLIAGSSGTGKTLLVHELAQETKGAIFHYHGTNLALTPSLFDTPISTEQITKQAYEKFDTILNQSHCHALAARAPLAILLIDSWEWFINSHMPPTKFQLLDHMHTQLKQKTCPPILLIAETTNEYFPSPDEECFYSFFNKISIGTPDELSRKEILDFYGTVYTSSLLDLDTKIIAQKTNGKTGLQLKKLIYKAATLACYEKTSNQPLEKKHIYEALNLPNPDTIVPPPIPPAPPETFDHLARQQTTRFSNIAGEIPDDIKELVVAIKESESFKDYGLTPPHGILLSGPTGTGKTLLARAIAGEVDAGFFIASGSEFIEKYIGIGAQRIRELFAEAKKYTQLHPDKHAIIFIDEIDAIGCKRPEGTHGASNEIRQTINEILTQMDGFITNHKITIIAATNMPTGLDEALIRPGRFDKKIEIGLPDTKKIKAVLQFYTNTIPAPKAPQSLDLDSLTPKCRGLNNAELKKIIDEAKTLARRAKAPTVSQDFFEAALEIVKKQKNVNEPPMGMYS